jgi:hypothetical protein
MCDTRPLTARRPTNRRRPADEPIDITTATRDYERWLATHTPLIDRDVRLKHERMRSDPFVFLRATFYRWLQLWPTICAALDEAPSVLSVGDLHIENFGTWRDREGRLIWGVNDVDEACRLPFTSDLVRLATSAMLAGRGGALHVGGGAICDAILEGYTDALECGGRPFVLAERRRWLRDIALSDLRDPVKFWSALTALPTVTGGLPHHALRALLPEADLPYRVVRRVAGAGSLGRPRFVALAEWRGGLIAREAKALAPSAAVWLEPRANARAGGAALLARAVRAADPLFALEDRWIVRRLAPDCTRIELAQLPRRRDESKLLRSMGYETANIHLGSEHARLAADLKRRHPRWLERSARAMADAVTSDWRSWRRRR